jgi:hypothetical protein
VSNVGCRTQCVTAGQLRHNYPTNSMSMAVIACGVVLACSAGVAAAQCANDPTGLLAAEGGCAAVVPTSGCDAFALPPNNGSTLLSLCPGSCDEACFLCAAGSGERAGYTIASSSATNVSGLGSIKCDRGYVPTAGGICPILAYGITDACALYGLCTRATCEQWTGTWKPVDPSAECPAATSQSSSNFTFAGCGCPMGTFLNLTIDLWALKSSIQQAAADAGIMYDPASAPPVTICQLCPAGTHSPDGSVSVDQCEPCGAGQHDHDRDPGTPCIDCAAGNFSTGPLSCVACAANTYSETAGSTECTECHNDRVSDAGSDDVEECRCRSGLLPVSERTVQESCAATDVNTCGTGERSCRPRFLRTSCSDLC